MYILCDIFTDSHQITTNYTVTYYNYSIYCDIALRSTIHLRNSIFTTNLLIAGTLCSHSIPSLHPLSTLLYYIFPLLSSSTTLSITIFSSFIETLFTNFSKNSSSHWSTQLQSRNRYHTFSFGCADVALHWMTLSHPLTFTISFRFLTDCMAPKRKRSFLNYSFLL